MWQLIRGLYTLLPATLSSLDTGVTSFPAKEMRMAAQFDPFTPLTNVTGQPSLSFPLYWNCEWLADGFAFHGALRR